MKVLAVVWKYLGPVISIVVTVFAYELSMLSLTEFRISAALLLLWAIIRLFAPLLLTLFLGKRGR